MKYYKQEVLHDPKTGNFGDCQRAAIATVLQLDMSEVPHFNEGGPDSLEFFDRISEFLNQRGMTLFSIPFQACPLEDLLRTMGVNNENTVYMLSGTTPRGVNHVVVCKGGKLIHDPHPSNDGLTGPCDDGYWWIEIVAVQP